MPLLEVVIVCSTGGRELLRACLASLRDHPPSRGDMHVTVVDNASADGAPQMVRECFPEVTLIALDHNAGFTVANNLVLREARSPFVLVLNPDTEVSAGALDHMLGLMEARPDVGMASCRLALRDGSLDHAAKRSFPTPVGALAHFVGIGRLPWAPRRLAQYRAPQLGEYECGEVDAVNGAFMLVRREALEDVGLMDEGYWLYMDDLDWCMRFQRRGWRVLYDGSVTVLHVKGGTTVRNRVRSLRHTVAFHRSMGRFYRKFHAGRAWVDVPVFAAILGKLAIASVRSVIVRRRVS